MSINYEGNTFTLNQFWKAHFKKPQELIIFSDENIIWHTVFIVSVFCQTVMYYNEFETTNFFFFFYIYTVNPKMKNKEEKKILLCYAEERKSYRFGTT